MIETASEFKKLGIFIYIYIYLCKERTLNFLQVIIITVGVVRI